MVLGKVVTHSCYTNLSHSREEIFLTSQIWSSILRRRYAKQFSGCPFSDRMSDRIEQSQGGNIFFGVKQRRCLTSPCRCRAQTFFKNCH